MRRVSELWSSSLGWNGKFSLVRVLIGLASTQSAWIWVFDNFVVSVATLLLRIGWFGFLSRPLGKAIYFFFVAVHLLVLFFINLGCASQPNVWEDVLTHCDSWENVVCTPISSLSTSRRVVIFRFVIFSFSHPTLDVATISTCQAGIFRSFAFSRGGELSVTIDYATRSCARKGSVAL